MQAVGVSQTRAGLRLHAWKWLPLALLLGGAGLLRFAFLEVRSLSFDETFSVAVARLPWLEGVRLVARTDAHPPLYYVLLHLWLRVGDSPAAVRSLSAIFGSAAVAMTYVLGRAIAGRAFALAAGLLLAGSAFAVQASAEARMGALLMFLAVGATAALWHAAAAPGRRQRWVLYAAVMTGAIYTHYFAFLLPAAHAVHVFAVLGRQRAVRLPFLLAVAGAVLAYAPWWPAAAQQLGAGHAQSVWSGRFPAWAPMNLLALSSFGGYVLGLGGYLFAPSRTTWVQALALLPFLVCLIAGAYSLRRRGGALLLASWLLPLGALIAASLLSGIFYALPRQMSFLQPFFVLLVAGGIGVLASRGRSRVAAIALMAAMLAVNLFVLTGSAADPRAQPFDWAGAARYVQERWRPGDRLVYYPHTARVAFAYYFSPPGAQALTLFPPPWSAGLTQAQLTAAFPDLSRLLGEAERFWLILTEPVPPGSTEALLAAADRHYYRERVVDFRRIYVVLYARR